MKKPTQREVVASQLKEFGEITNVWAMEHFIYRLSERIRELEALGWKIEGDFVWKDGKKTGTYLYKLQNGPVEPPRPIYLVRHPLSGLMVTPDQL